MALVGAIVGGVGQLVAGAAQKKQNDYQAAVAENNKVVAEQNAVYEEQAGAVEEQAQRAKTHAALGTAEAIQGASGFDVTSPSFAGVRGSIASLGELDARTIRANAARRAYGYRTQGTNFGAEAELSRMAGRNAMLTGGINAFTSIIGGASSVSSKWGGYRYTPLAAAAPPAYTPRPLLSYSGPGHPF